MRWLKPNLVTSLYALLGHTSEPSLDHLSSAVDRIRDAMVALLGEQGQTDHPWLARRLRHATELQTLWYARSDLLSARAAICGEARARREVEEITRLFNGLVPSSLKTRSRRLSG